VQDNTLLILITILAAMPPTLMALAAYLVSTHSSAKADATNVKVDVVASKVEEVHTLTNRNFTEQKQEIAELRAQLQTAMDTAAIAELARVALAQEARRDQIEAKARAAQMAVGQADEKDVEKPR
jgi:hypothetical protein